MRRLALLLALVPAFAAATECRYSEPRQFDLDAAALKTVAFDLGSTDLVVEGVPELARVEVRGKACASDPARLAELVVDQRVEGDRATITPRGTHGINIGLFHSSYAYIDLEVRVPARLALDIRSTSGDAKVRGVAAARFDASSGDLEVHRVAGALTVEVSSGDVRGDDLGRAEIRTSSGDIRLRDVHGDIEVARSGSGDLTFDSVSGSVRIDRVGSGDVEVSRTGGDVAIDSIGSGDVNVNAIGGNFSVRSRGSGDVAHRDVRGTVSVPRGND